MGPRELERTSQCYASDKRDHVENFVKGIIFKLTVKNLMQNKNLFQNRLEQP